MLADDLTVPCSASGAFCDIRACAGTHEIPLQPVTLLAFEQGSSPLRALPARQHGQCTKYTDEVWGIPFDDEAWAPVIVSGGTWKSKTNSTALRTNAKTLNWATAFAQSERSVLCVLARPLCRVTSCHHCYYYNGRLNFRAGGALDESSAKHHDDAIRVADG